LPLVQRIAIRVVIACKMNQTTKELLSGSAGGIAQVLAGQPMDLIKVRLQSSNAYNGPIDAFRRIVAEEGPLAFYKGTVAPLIGIGACVSIQFAALGAIQRIFVEQNIKRGRSSQLDAGQLYLAGAGAGVANSVVSGPVEHIRIRLQTQPTPKAGTVPLYLGPVDAVKMIHRSDGLRGIYQGQIATLWREFHGYGMYFLTYEYLVQRQCVKQNCTRQELSTANVMTYGILAGWSLWLTAYPLDVIKSRMQTDAFPSQGNLRQYNSTFDCVKQLYRQQGVKGFFRGLMPALIRSPFANAATFATYEAALAFLT